MRVLTLSAAEVERRCKQILETIKGLGLTEDEIEAKIANLQTQMLCPDCDKALCVC